MTELILDINHLVGYLLHRRHPTGVDRVCLEYVRHFQYRAHALVRFGSRWIVYNKKDSWLIFNILLQSDVSCFIRACFKLGYSYIADWHRYEKKPAILVNPSHSGLESSTYKQQIIDKNIQPLFFLHDLIPITHPNYCLPDEKIKHQKRLATMLSVGSGIVSNSLAVHIELERYATRNGFITIPPCVIAPLAPTQLPKPANQSLMNDPYFVILGTIEPRKNHLLLLHLWQQLVNELGDNTPRLVIIGKRGWNIKKELNLLNHCPILCNFVIELPHCNDADLSTWIHHAQALLFPTFTEGFGIPLHEALMLGVPVIASNLSVFYETAADIPEYIEPLDMTRWKQLILDYSQRDSTRRQAQCERIKKYKAPTWDNHFRMVDQLIDKLNPLLSNNF